MFGIETSKLKYGNHLFKNLTRPFFKQESIQIIWYDLIQMFNNRRKDRYWQKKLYLYCDKLGDKTQNCWKKPSEFEVQTTSTKTKKLEIENIQSW